MFKYAFRSIRPIFFQVVIDTMREQVHPVVKFAGCLSFLFAANSALACDYPSQVTIPNGSTASQEEMIEGQRGVKQYVADMETYLECIVEEEKAARAEIEDLEPEDAAQREAMLTKKYNAAVDEMEKTAAKFNAEVQAYKNRDN